MKKHWIQMAVLAIALAAFGNAKAAAIAAVSFDSGDTLFSGLGYEMGYVFTPTVDILVTDLGFYDLGGDGLSQSHDVGIFDTTVDLSLLASVTVASGTADPLIGTLPNGAFRYHSLVTPLLLLANQTYAIAGIMGGSGTADAIPYDGFTNIAADPLITVDFVNGGRYTTSDVLVYPAGTASGQFYMAPNFLFTTVPEPSSVALMCIGGVAVLSWRIRKQARTL